MNVPRIRFNQQAHLVLGVPTDVARKGGSPGEDTISFNTHRCHPLWDLDLELGMSYFQELVWHKPLF